MLRCNHYEVAFESFLRQKRVPYLAVEEQYRNRLANGKTLKNLDFVISRPTGLSYLVDVKGRIFSADRGYWKNWSTRDDLVGLKHWEQLFGTNFSGLFVFAYQISGGLSPLPPDKLFSFRNRLYGFVGISFHDYISQIRLLSPKWRTFAMPTRAFRQLAKPFEDFL